MIHGLPQWRCHKVVGAIKIDAAEADFDAGVVRVRVSDGRALPILVPATKWPRPRSVDGSRGLNITEMVGGYLVQYEDGYLSWSPAAAFEAGYTRIEP